MTGLCGNRQIACVCACLHYRLIAQIFGIAGAHGHLTFRFNNIINKHCRFVQQSITVSFRVNSEPISYIQCIWIKNGRQWGSCRSWLSWKARRLDADEQILPEQSWWTASLARIKQSASYNTTKMCWMRERNDVPLSGELIFQTVYLFLNSR